MAEIILRVNKINHMAYINTQDVLYFQRNIHLTISKYFRDLEFFEFKIILQNLLVNLIKYFLF